MPVHYSTRLLAQLAAYKKLQHPDLADGTRHHEAIDTSCAHILPKERYAANILPTIRDDFWRWFEKRERKIALNQSFHQLDSSQAMEFNLLFHFVQGETIDRRLLQVLGLADGSDYTGGFEKVLHPEDNTRFDFYMESTAGMRIFVELALAEEDFGSCGEDQAHQDELRDHYRPYLQDHVDAKWLESAAFCANYEVLRKLSYLGRYPDSGVAFVFPKANEGLKQAEATIKQIVSKSLAPRVAILYLEYLVEKILTAVADDAPLKRHYLAFRDKYVCL